MCGFSVEVSKCFPSDRFSIFLNEVYLASRHVVHGVRVAMAISAEPTEKHTTLIERVTSVSTGCRGAIMVGLNPLSAIILMAFHCYMHIREWTVEWDPMLLSVWSLALRTWGGLGLSNIMQIFIFGSGTAFKEGVAMMQAYARRNAAAKKFFSNMCKTTLQDRMAAGVLTAPLSARVFDDYMVDNRVGSMVWSMLILLMKDGRSSSYATRPELPRVCRGCCAVRGDRGPARADAGQRTECPPA